MCFQKSYLEYFVLGFVTLDGTVWVFMYECWVLKICAAIYGMVMNTFIFFVHRRSRLSMASTVMADIVIAYAVMACVAMACIVMV